MTGKSGTARQQLETPSVLPVFPLSGALLLPHAQLPLNIFEPQYLRMVDDALAGSRLIGIVQPREESAHHPRLFDVACAGRITSFSETGDGRYLITLTGTRRFRIDAEIEADTPYRVASADWHPYEIDIHGDDTIDEIDRQALMAAAKQYLEIEGMQVDWEAADNAPIDALIASFAMGCSFEPNEKQALLEALTNSERAECLMKLMAIYSAGSAPADDQALQ